MYRTQNFQWKAVHVLAILAHVGLVIASSVSFVQNLNMGRDNNDRNAIDWSKVVSSNSNPCSFALMGGFGRLGSSDVFDVAIYTLPLSALAVGIVGLIFNIVLFVILLAVETSRPSLTEGEQHWRKQIVTFFGCVFNLLLAGAGIGLACTMGLKISVSRSLISPTALAAIQSPICMCTAVYDAVKNHRDGKGLLD
ncbi:hypothetical protein B0T24DRAFT_528681 [Lasiosphaeria ovina]|uniref:Uncharacterized protein n=1 Tax=Lasiosphaeria ovina TaxID=92902 RepID=A0AAE0N6W0_9PEZI|nr:hypothetical protein B0T24DRAFT_528681 [Lasiosphaeria ovina]